MGTVEVYLRTPQVVCKSTYFRKVISTNLGVALFSMRAVHPYWICYSVLNTESDSVAFHSKRHHLRALTMIPPMREPVRCVEAASDVLSISTPSRAVGGSHTEPGAATAVPPAIRGGR